MAEEHDGKHYVLGPLEAALKAWQDEWLMDDREERCYDSTLSNAIDDYFGRQPGFTVQGSPLSDLGLEDAHIRYADGTIRQLTGFVCLPGMAIHESLQASLPEGAELYATHEDAVAAQVRDGFDEAKRAAREHAAQIAVEAWRKANPDIVGAWRKNVHDYRPGGFVMPHPVDELARVARLDLKREPQKPVKSTGDAFLGRNTIYGVNDGDYTTPYMTRYWAGRLRLHIFHRGDADADPHDHPWNFWTFPLTSYVEEVTIRDLFGPDGHGVHYRVERRVVLAFRLHYRAATHTHRVLGPVLWRNDRLATPVYGAEGQPMYTIGAIVTIVWRGNGGRKWGFLRKDAAGKRCWIPWRTYVYEGGKHAPCE